MIDESVACFHQNPKKSAHFHFCIPCEHSLTKKMRSIGQIVVSASERFRLQAHCSTPQYSPQRQGHYTTATAAGLFFCSGTPRDAQGSPIECDFERTQRHHFGRLQGKAGPLHCSSRHDQRRFRTTGTTSQAGELAIPTKECKVYCWSGDV